jgi:hypothetical protein
MNNDVKIQTTTDASHRALAPAAAEPSSQQRTLIVVLTLIGMPVLAYIFLTSIFDFALTVLRTLIALIR